MSTKARTGHEERGYRGFKHQSRAPFLKESNMKKQKKTPQPRNYLVKLALFRKAGSHRKSNKAIRRLEKSKKNYYSEAYLNLYKNVNSGSGLVSQNLYTVSSFHPSMLHYNNSVHSTTDSAVAF